MAQGEAMSRVKAYASRQGQFKYSVK